jgi:hypothetical protein
MNSYDEDVLYLQIKGYKFTEKQAIEFSDICNRLYADGMDIETARKEAALTLNLS